jgi:hypothetical protein
MGRMFDQTPASIGRSKSDENKVVKQVTLEGDR